VDQALYEKQLIEFLTETAKKRPEFENKFRRHQILSDNTATTDFDSHYIYHVAWAVRKLREMTPEVHVDFSSALQFCTTVSALCKTKFFDFRPAQLFLDNLECSSCDLSSPSFDVGQFTSVSCMHVIEHIGLGRYGDTLDAEGDLKAIHNLKKTVLPGGNIFFVVPCGSPSISFNAHRIYAPESIIQYFGDEFQLMEFYFIPGPPNIPPLLNPELSMALAYDYGCGCFHFKRKTAT
jgi:hypothetical protein